ncbi:M15 family metallopeptidase [Propioniciclava coleopterorum]|uniref:M15 family metallopeptidase n=1 Tax=Propioniciclava coleopterorum TaxID=2714937 RepID=A0A6G7Y667_9ACTN|nr:M15 family metallopeptidase [Propioniciclava coleopterorum]QIK72312.1 M15 family metallopeptidase [Propioniciclava coleopterorum]
MVSKTHRVSAGYVPDWAGRSNGLHPDATAGFGRLAAAAKADGLTMSIRSGYRSFATQKASFDKAMRTYPEATARRYYAEPGASEHQTGLSLDAWDGRNRGSAFARTPHAAWLAKHAFEHGFIVRYPDGKTDITGYAWESWHLRWVGVEVAAAFGPDSSLTLEEYLGLA